MVGLVLVCLFVFILSIELFKMLRNLLSWKLLLVFPIQPLKVFIQPELTRSVAVNADCFSRVLRGLVLKTSESVSSFLLPSRLCP